VEKVDADVEEADVEEVDMEKEGERNIKKQALNLTLKKFLLTMS
jgi:hypothetical protein